MLISDKRKIKDIQDEFSKKFNFLKIKFYKHPHRAYQGSESREEWNSQLSLGEIRKDKNGEDFQVEGSMSIKDFEGQMSKSFGLNVQVFRASTNDVWLQTIATDHWTLSESNEKAARLISKEN